MERLETSMSTRKIVQWDPGSPSACLVSDGDTLGNLDEAPVGNNTKKGWIYQLLFPNGLKYVGQTASWKQRMRSHKRGKGRDDGQLIKRAIRKYGWNNVKVSVLQTIAIGGLSKKERRAVLSPAEVEWIARLGTLKPGGYNTTPGGDAQPMDDPEVAAWQKQQIKEAMNRPDVRAKKRGLWQDPEHRAMMHAARTGSAVWMQTRKDCQNTDECNEKRRATWARKRAAKVAAMGVAEGREFMRRAKKSAVRLARQAAKRIADHSDRDSVAETEAFWDKEIAGYEAGIWRALTPASSCEMSEKARGKQSTLAKWLKPDSGSSSGSKLTKSRPSASKETTQNQYESSDEESYKESDESGDEESE